MGQLIANNLKDQDKNDVIMKTQESKREITEESSQGNDDSFFSTLRDPKRKDTNQITATTLKN